MITHQKPEAVRPPEQVAAGVFQLKVPIPGNPLGNVLAYLLPGPQGATLIDTGWNDQESFNSLEGQLEAAGITFQDISQIIVTHYHPDHFGLAGRVKAASGARVLMHRLEDEQVALRRDQTGAFMASLDGWLRQNGVPEGRIPRRGRGAPELPRLFDGKADVLLEGGERIPAGHKELLAILTPGHAPGHICLYDGEEGLLFSGDHLLPVITPNVGLDPPGGKNPLGDYLQSLDEIKALQVKRVLPGHEYVFENFSDRIEEIAAHHGQRLEEILSFLEKTGSTAYQVASRVSWAIGEYSLLSNWDQKAAVLEVLAHLELARCEGRVDRRIEDGKAVFFPKI